MPAGRPPSDIDQYKEEISSSFLNGQSASNITKILSDKYQITVHSQTIRRRLQQWGVSRTNHESKELEDKIKELYFQHGLRDRQIIHALEKNGIKISQSTLTTIRRRLGLHRRVVNPEDIQNINDLVRAEVQKQLNSGRIEGYGRGHLYRFFRLKGYNIARDRLYSIVQELDPDGVKRRKSDVYRRRGEYVVPGPNYIWSMDGHDKLSFWGIQIYAAIDAFSRYITWCYVGISNRTQISVLRQFLEVLQETKIQPRYIRSDKGGETVLVAAAHYLLLKEQYENLFLQDCYLYGTSTSNQRIEAWWSQLTKSLLFIFRDYFLKLSNDGYFKKNSLADRIAILAIYMPMAREEIASYINVWNTHGIRKQSHRINSINGQPNVLYHLSEDGIQDYGSKPDQVVLQTLLDEHNFELDEYLPLDTLNWCQQKLQSQGFERIKLEDLNEHGERTHFIAYLYLRDQINLHIATQSEPQLRECEKPTQEELHLQQDLQDVATDLTNQPWFSR
ncbi:hypothetical protein TMatcc_005566 [Talaromyces marneffei ATCC 18224]|uniref:Integrase core domain-containing protein n=1 Tax=Talaromyces marneffei (strain ATCC 18224 / CBS 334.59 / QM 7333) TaxID=441960 RepID=B6QUE0_TALMQ|nr:hypothetical protein PMAA_008790 [Talaromyces marneffei ATCC 18224]